ncbi:MAG TPA: A/G-specific adenine glycosylase, partial [Armatimonadota bacterium]
MRKQSTGRLLHKRKFQQALLAWFSAYQRDLPWRRTFDPYHVLVSEMMLQQTQVDRVIPKYAEWLEKYPTLEALAEADLDDVKSTWKGLGYNIRPVRLHSIACETVAEYGGELPREAEKLQQFTGIGRYTAGAVASLAYRQDAPILDTNVRRVLFRIFVGEGEMRSSAMENRLWEIAEKTLPRGQAWEFNSALMDFGATWCTAFRPQCTACPMADFCHQRRL